MFVCCCSSQEQTLLDKKFLGSGFIGLVWPFVCKEFIFFFHLVQISNKIEIVNLFSLRLT